MFENMSPTRKKRQARRRGIVRIVAESPFILAYFAVLKTDFTQLAAVRVCSLTLCQAVPRGKPRR
jgi:hypothetical protein